MYIETIRINRNNQSKRRKLKKMILIDILLYTAVIFWTFKVEILTIAAVAWTVRHKFWLLDVLNLDGYDNLWEKFREQYKQRQNVSRETMTEE